MLDKCPTHELSTPPNSQPSFLLTILWQGHGNFPRLALDSRNSFGRPWTCNPLAWIFGVTGITGLSHQAWLSVPSFLGGLNHISLYVYTAFLLSSHLSLVSWSASHLNYYRNPVWIYQNEGLMSLPPVSWTGWIQMVLCVTEYGVQTCLSVSFSVDVNSRSVKALFYIWRNALPTGLSETWCKGKQEARAWRRTGHGQLRVGFPTEASSESAFCLDHLLATPWCGHQRGDLIAPGQVPNTTVSCLCDFGQVTLASFSPQSLCLRELGGTYWT